MQNTIMINIETEFWNADQAFRYFYKKISKHGTKFADTRALFNIGFTIHKPQMRMIPTKMRKWNHEYAEAEWQWYLNGDPSIESLGDIYGKIPEIWKRMADKHGYVNSNYGHQWKRERQLHYIVAMLKADPETRRATISIYDGKEITNYSHDTPCTYAVQFTIVNNRLDMCVTMRSNDLWYGFCNDQYQFSKLQEMVSKRLNIETGVYYHFAHNMHLYNDKI